MIENQPFVELVMRNLFGIRDPGPMRQVLDHVPTVFLFRVRKHKEPAIATNDVFTRNFSTTAPGNRFRKSAIENVPSGQSMTW